MRAQYLLSLATFILGVHTTFAQTNWPQFRGPGMTGVVADDPRLPETWSKTDNVHWSVEVPGVGWSNPVVWGDRVYLTSVTDDGDNEKPKAGLYLGQGVRDAPASVHHWMVYCLDLATGKILWEREARAGSPIVPRHPKNTYASETPTTDGERVYALFGDLGLYCYSMDGELLWTHAIEPKKTQFDYGAAASPVLHDGKVIYVYDNNEDSYIAALDCKTGDVAWKIDRDENSTWATPFIWRNDLRTEIVTCGFKRNRSYDLSGKVLWEFDGKMSRLIIPSPFEAGGLLYITSGYVGDNHRPAYAIRPGASGDISLKENEKSNDFIVWYQPDIGPYNPSSIVYRDIYYTLLDRGFVTANDAKTGAEIYGRQRIDGATFTASPWAYNGKVFCLSEDGDTYVIKAGNEFEILATNTLDELCLASPAIADGKLLIRTVSRLYCIGAH